MSVAAAFRMLTKMPYLVALEFDGSRLEQSAWNAQSAVQLERKTTTAASNVDDPSPCTKCCRTERGEQPARKLNETATVCRYFCTRMRVIGVNIGRDVRLALGSRLCYPPIISGRARVVPEWASAMPARLAARPHLADAGLFLWLLDTRPTFFHHAPSGLVHSVRMACAANGRETDLFMEKRTSLWSASGVVSLTAGRGVSSRVLKDSCKGFQSISKARIHYRESDT